MRLRRLPGHSVDGQDVLRARGEDHDRVELRSNVIASPGRVTGGSKESAPPLCQGMFMNRLSGLGVSGGVRPRACIAAQRLSVQLSWYSVQPSSPYRWLSQAAMSVS